MEVETVNFIAKYVWMPLIGVIDGDAGRPCLAVNNGTNWLRVALGSAVSAT